MGSFYDLVIDPLSPQFDHPSQGDIMGPLGDIMDGELPKEVGLVHLIFAAVVFDAHPQLTRSPRRRRESPVFPTSHPRGWLVVN